MNTQPSTSFDVDASGLSQSSSTHPIPTLQTRNDAGLICPICCKKFTLKRNLTRHLKTICKQEKTLYCDKCKKKIGNRKDKFELHVSTCKGRKNVCLRCNVEFPTKLLLRNHNKTCKKTTDLRTKRAKVNRVTLPRDEESGILILRSAFNNNLTTYIIPNKEGANNLKEYFTSTLDLMRQKINTHLEDYPVKINFIVESTYENPVTKDRAECNFKTKSTAVYTMTDIDEILLKGVDKIENEIHTYEGSPSGLKLSSINNIVLNVSKFNPLKSACNIPLPSWIVKTQSVDHAIYPDNEDCFRQAVLSRVPHGRVYDFSALTFPTMLKDIPKFENKNKVRVNIFALDEKEKLYPYKVSELKTDEYIDLLLLSAGNHNHFVRIFNFDRLVRSQITRRKSAIAVCKRCFSHFDSRYGMSKEEKLRLHGNDCVEQPARMIMPEGLKSKLSFISGRNQIRVPFVAYCDTESLLIPIATCEPCSSGHYRSYTNKIQEHQIMSFGLYVKSDIHTSEEDEDFNNMIIYTGPDAAKKLILKLASIAAKVLGFYSLNTSVIMSDQELLAHESAITCYLCGRGFSDDLEKIREHCHITGRYRGAAHRSCNIAAKKPDFLPVFLHFGSGYDFKFIVRELGNLRGEIKVLADTSEKYISVSKQIICTQGMIWLRFLDSFRFLPSSLDALVKTMTPDRYKILPKLYAGRQLELLLRKGQMPYEYMSEWEKLDETSLPPRESFYSRLNESGISEDEYKHAVEVWNEFNIRNLREYSELYLRTDVYLLAEVFENFRREFFNSEYNLEVVNYYSIPGLAFNGMLKVTNVQLDLITDYTMLLFIERGIRGGFTQVSRRFVEVDNSQQMCYIDANNLYGLASSEILPMKDFRWVDPRDVNLLTVSDKSAVGYIAEVDIEIPDNLHDYFNDLPPLPERIKPAGSNYIKLIATLSPKTKYVLHYKLLQFVVAHGCVLKTVHRVLGFQQSAWLEPFIRVNNEKRKLAKNLFEKDLYKLLVNSNYGKMIENVRNRMDLRLVTTWSRAEKLIAKPNFKSRVIIEENLVAIHMSKTKIIFDKPNFVGMSLLDLAKMRMLSMHYDQMIRHYGPERLTLAYTDTDSFIYAIKTADEDWRVEAFRALGHEFDFSNLPSDHPCYSTVNKQVLGKFKDETAGRKIKSFVGLRAKMYAIEIEGIESIKKAKGVKRSAVKNKIEFEDFKRALFESKTMSTKFNLIRSYRLRLYTVAINKLALSSTDDKRHILPDKITTLAYGHHRIMEIDEGSDVAGGSDIVNAE